jgi:hypothetical protein
MLTKTLTASLVAGLLLAGCGQAPLSANTRPASRPAMQAAQGPAEITSLFIANHTGFGFRSTTVTISGKRDGAAFDLVAARIIGLDGAVRVSVEIDGVTMSKTTARQLLAQAKLGAGVSEAERTSALNLIGF